MPQTSIIGLILPYDLAYCRGVLRGIRQFAETRPNWSCMLVGPETGAVQSLLRLRPAGLIAFVFKQSLGRALRRPRCPLVNVCGVLPDTGMARVGLDDAAVGCLAATHLLERGLWHFAFLGHTNHAGSKRRELSFQATVTAAGGIFSAYHPSRSGVFYPAGGIWTLNSDFRHWLQGLPKPVGIFAYFDMWGLQLAEACRQVGLRVPEDVFLLGTDNDDLLCALARPSLSSIAIPTDKIGYEAAAMLDGMFGGRTPPRQPLLFPPLGVVIRRSSDLFAIADADVAAAIRFIHDNGSRPISVADVLDAVPVSRRLLERRFRGVRRRGIGEEIRHVRVERAKDLLGDATMPIAGVARHSGFSDTRHLAVAFRRATGLTPTNYRRSILAVSGQEPEVK